MSEDKVINSTVLKMWLLEALGLMLRMAAIGILWNQDHQSLQNDLRDAEERLEGESVAYEQQRARNANMSQVVNLDEDIITRYQKSVNSCRESFQNAMDGNYPAALLYAKDVGETEDDIGPMLQERRNLLQGTNADLL